MNKKLQMLPLIVTGYGPPHPPKRSLGLSTHCHVRSGAMHHSAVELTTCDLLLLGLPFQISGRLQKGIDAHCA